jgi:AcrR family transcriptional regulator
MMARPRSLDRERLLDLAERIVTEAGVAGLTFGSLAIAADSSKASVQSAFKTRNGLLDAMLDRWLKREQVRFDTELGERTSARDRMLAHIRVTEALTPNEGQSAAALVIALAGSNTAGDTLKAWYAARAGLLAAMTGEERQLRLAFLAVEGAYFLRYALGLSIDDNLWGEIFGDIAAAAGGRTGAPPT